MEKTNRTLHGVPFKWLFPFATFHLLGTALEKIMVICVCKSRQGGGGGEQGKEMEEIPGIFLYFAQPVFCRLARRKEKVILPGEMPRDGLPPPFSFNL
jgi:hypothetical protein